jgi:enoyl-CoA hydratase/carnithine racemase
MTGEVDAPSILYETSGTVLTLILNRPDRLNAFNSQMLEALQAALDRAEQDDGVRVVIIKGAGRAFSSGMDLQGGYNPTTLGVTGDRQRLEKVIRDFLRIWEFPKPVIGQVHGICAAAATMLALCCDITLVSNECRIRFPSIPVGGGFVSSFWAYFVGPKKAKEMDFVAGSELTGTEASQIGWANRSIPSEELEAHALQLARLIARTPGDLLRLKKLAINRVTEAQGFSQAMLGGAEWDTLCHFSHGASEIRELIADKGLKGAIEHFQRLA